jgi:hypothetical protein
MHLLAWCERQHPNNAMNSIASGTMQDLNAQLYFTPPKANSNAGLTYTQA